MQSYLQGFGHGDRVVGKNPTYFDLIQIEKEQVDLNLPHVQRGRVVDDAGIIPVNDPFLAWQEIDPISSFIEDIDEQITDLFNRLRVTESKVMKKFISSKIDEMKREKLQVYKDLKEGNHYLYE